MEPRRACAAASPPGRRPRLPHVAAPGLPESTAGDAQARGVRSGPGWVGLTHSSGTLRMRSHHVPSGTVVRRGSPIGIIISPRHRPVAAGWSAPSPRRTRTSGADPGECSGQQTGAPGLARHRLLLAPTGLARPGWLSGYGTDECCACLVASCSVNLRALPPPDPRQRRRTTTCALDAARRRTTSPTTASHRRWRTTTPEFTRCYLAPARGSVPPILTRERQRQQKTSATAAVTHGILLASGTTRLGIPRCSNDDQPGVAGRGELLTIGDGGADAIIG